ncbi:MAG: 50S ribosomal protein L23 [Candidatus Kapaibacteriales bacterium]
MIQVIKKPIITEKGMQLAETGQYMFEVTIDSNKIQIKKAVQEMFDVNVTSVRTAVLKGKRKSRMTKRGYMTGKFANKKRAYVTLEKGQSIEIVSGGEAE